MIKPANQNITGTSVVSRPLKKITMKIFRGLPILLLWLETATAAPAAGLERRQQDVIKGALSKVTGSLKSLDTAVNGVGTDPSSLLTLLDTAKKTEKSLSEAKVAIEGSKKLGLFEALGVMGPANDLVAQVQKTMTDLTAKKPTFDQLGATSVVADALKQQKAKSGGLAEAVQGKLPQLAQSLAGGTTDSLNKAVGDTIKAYEAPPAKTLPRRGPGA